MDCSLGITRTDRFETFGKKSAGWPLRGSSPVILKESARVSRLVQIGTYPLIPTLETRLLTRPHNLRTNF